MGGGKVVNNLTVVLKKLFQAIVKTLSWKEPDNWREPVTGKSKDNLIRVLEEAHQEWIHAKFYFNCVTDPDLVDHAIFYMGETEKKYTYLLKRAREMGLNTDFSLIK